MHEEQKMSNMTPQEQQRKIKELEARLAAKEGAEVRSIGTKVHSDLHRGHQRKTIDGEPNPAYRERNNTVQLGPQPSTPPPTDAAMEENAFIMAAGEAALAAKRALEQ